MTKASDALADALFIAEFPWEFGYAWKPISQEHLRTLAREAEAMGAKRALEEAAEELDNGDPIRQFTLRWLRARAEQIGD